MGNDSYLEDLLNQKESREQDRQEELMDDAAEMYRAAVAEGAPESEALFFQFLEELKKERAEEFKEKDRKQDELIKTETERLKNKDSAIETIDEHYESLDKMQQKHEETRAGLGEEEIEFETDSDVGLTTDEEVEDKKLSSPTKTSTKHSPRASPRMSPRRKQSKAGSVGKAPFQEDIPETVSVPSYEDNSQFLDDEDLSDRSERRRKMRKKMKKKRLAKERKRRRMKKKRRRRRAVYFSDSEESSSVSSFGDEYGYDAEEIRELDMAAVEISRREISLNEQISKQTRTRLIAASLVCCVGFVLLLFFVLDPLGRNDDGNPFSDKSGEQRLLRGRGGAV